MAETFVIHIVFHLSEDVYKRQVMFYVLLALAALTSTISLHEVVTAFLHEEFNLTRGRAARLVTFGLSLIHIWPPMTPVQVVMSGRRRSVCKRPKS